MGGSFGPLFGVTTFGQSHGGGMGVVIAFAVVCLLGLPARAFMRTSWRLSAQESP